MSARIAAVTGSRAEYGLLHPLLVLLRDADWADLRIVATGMHLSPAHGLTYREIEADGFIIDERVEMLAGTDTRLATAVSMGEGLARIAEALARLAPDAVVLLGDRYEVLSAAAAALVLGIPVAHLHGGELTEAAVDDAIRHAVTKMSWLHFVAAEPYARRVLQMGEEADRVFTVGAPGLDNVRTTPLLPPEEALGRLGGRPGGATLLVTFHPETAGAGDPSAQVSELLAALDELGCGVLFTMPNADPGNLAIRTAIEAWVAAHEDRAEAVTSLGRVRYLSALAAADAVVGNSSSGIIEAPSVCTPTVNVGDRQRGRVRADTVVDCSVERSAIVSAVRAVLEPGFRERCAGAVNPYGDGHAAERISAVLRERLPVPPGAVKRFHDL